MHKKILKLLVILSLVAVPRINAACNYQETAELNKEVANIKITYEVAEGIFTRNDADTGEEFEDTYNFFKINILNLSDKFYIKYSNNQNKNTKTYDSSNASNGLISFDWKDLSKVTTMTFNVYTTSKTSCKNELYRTIYLTVPRYNPYHSWGICEGKENVSLCDEYVTSEELDYEEFVSRVNKVSQSNSGNKTNNNNNVNDVNTSAQSTYIYIIGGAILVITIIVIIVVSQKKRNRI